MRSSNPSDPVATALQEAIKVNGVAKVDLAREIGVSSNTITNWTKGRFRPSGQHAVLLAERLDLPLEMVLGHGPEAHAVPAPIPRSAEAENIVAQLAAIDPQPAARALGPVLDQLEKVLGDAKRYVAASTGSE